MVHGAMTGLVGVDGGGERDNQVRGTKYRLVGGRGDLWRGAKCRYKSRYTRIKTGRFMIHQMQTVTSMK